MSKHFYSDIPSWLLKPNQLQNVITNQLASLKDVPSYINMPDKSSFSSGLRQALHWKRRLSPSTSSSTVIFSFLGPKGLILPNVSEVCQALRNVCNILNIIEVYRAYNSHFMGISFNNSSDATKVRSTFSYFMDTIVIHVPISKPLMHHFKLLWLPPVFPDSRIHHFLNKYSAKHTFLRDFISTDSGTHYATNSITGTLELLPSVDINHLPHLIPLPPPHLGNALFIISGRPSFCLRCGQLGHVRNSCSTPRCASCHHYHLSSVSCITSDSILNSPPLDSYTFDDPDSTSETPPANLLIPSINHDNATPPSTAIPSDNTTILSPSSNVSKYTVSMASPISSADPPSTSCTLPAPKCDYPAQISSDNLALEASSNNYSDNSLQLASSSPFSDTTILNNKRVTRSMSANHRLQQNYHLSKDSNHEPPASSNIYTILNDEADNIVNDQPPTLIPSTFSNPEAVLLIDDNLPVICSNMQDSSIQSTQPSHIDIHDILKSPVIPTSGKLSPSSPSPSRKKLRSSSPNPVGPSASHASISCPPQLDWAHQVEELYPLQPSCPPSKLTLALNSEAQEVLSSAHSALVQILPLRYSKLSEFNVTCDKCCSHHILSWPISQLEPCFTCGAALIVLLEDVYIPCPSRYPVILTLSKTDYHDPALINYLMLCLRNQVSFHKYS